MTNVENSIHAIAEGLITKYPQILYHVEFEKLIFEYYSSDKGPVMSIEGVNQNGINLLVDSGVVERYTIRVNSQKIAELSPTSVEWIVLDTLLYIHHDCDGKVRPPSFKSHKVIVNAISRMQLGADYLYNPDLPDLLGEEEIELF